jgi:hypothetical protein
MPLLETRVIENQLVMIIAKEQFNQDCCKTEDFRTYSGNAGQKCLHGSPNAFVSAKTTPAAISRNHKAVVSHAGI